MEEKPSRAEDEYFARHNADLIKQLRAKQDAERQQTKQSLVCPRCNAALNEQKMESVLVDVCPQCGGVWFDAGELDIIRQTRGGGSFFDSLLGRRK